MTSWILWSLLFATLIALSALAAERIAAQQALPRRFIWMVAIVVIAVVPTAMAVRPVSVVDSVVLDSVEPASGASITTFEVPGNPSSRAQSDQKPYVAPDVDGWVVRAWLILSAVVFGTFAYSIIALKRKSARWLEVDLKLCRALIATDVGPAVIGFLRPRVVVPQWALHVDESARQMILRHEVEHLRARDPQALFASGVSLIALPWNLPLWWIVRRMRLAMELDCDARVVRSIGKSYEYGQVLLAVGERHMRNIPLAASLTGRRSLLEWRIKAMTMKKPRRPILASIPFAAFAFVALTAATRVSPPVPLLRSANNASASAGAGAGVIDGVEQSQATATVAKPAPTAAPSAQLPQAPTSIPVRAQAPAPAPALALTPALSPQQSFPTRAQIAAMLLANVPALGSRGDSSNYAVLVLDASNNFASATAGYGSVTIQVWGDTLDNNARAARTSQRAGLPIFAARAGGGGGARGGGAAGGRARPGGAAVDSMAIASANLRDRRFARSDSAVAVGGAGAAVAFRRRASDSSMTVGYRDSLARRLVAVDSLTRRMVAVDSFARRLVARRDTLGAARGGRGGGGRGAASGSAMDSTRYATGFARQQRLAVDGRAQFRLGNSNWVLRGADSTVPNNGPSNGYTLAFNHQPGRDPTTGAVAASPMNAASGLHVFQAGVADDSGIDGILASNLASLETFRFDTEFGRRSVDVIVVTKKR